jgi:hypothetical protein
MSIKQYNDAGTFSTTIVAQPTDNRIIIIPDISGTLALVDSQSFTGSPTAPTAPASTSTTQLATTAMVHSAITNDLNVTGTAPMYACRAWINFNGITTTINASGNISSIIKNGTGYYTVNFITAMSDTNYSILGSGNRVSAVPNIESSTQFSYSNATTTSVYIGSQDNDTNAYGDSVSISVSIFR